MAVSVCLGCDRLTVTHDGVCRSCEERQTALEALANKELGGGGDPEELKRPPLPRKPVVEHDDRFDRSHRKPRFGGPMYQPDQFDD
jgi:hypothetical protein